MKGKECKKEKKTEKTDNSTPKVKSDYQNDKTRKSAALPIAVKPKK